MACLINVLLVSVVVYSFWIDAVAQNAQVQDVDNAEQFALLCRIYNVAKNPPINNVDLQDPNNIVNEIDAINASFADEKQINKTEDVVNSSDAQVKPTITRQATVAQAVLSRLTQNAHTILEKIKKMNVTETIEKAKADFDQVIFGQGMNESQLCQGTLSGVSGREDACGKSGLFSKGSNAGSSLVVDFFCLCSMRTEISNEGLENVCGVKVGGKDGKSQKHGWGTSAPSGSSSMWASIKKGCGKLMHQHPKSTEEGDEVLVDFLKHLNTGGLYRWGENSKVVGSNRKQGMLGTGMVNKVGSESDLICDGSRGKNNQQHGGICVYYGTGSWENTIPWVIKLKAALATVNNLNNRTATIQRYIEKLQMLLHRAERIYETTKMILENQNPVVPTSLQTAAKRLTSYNAAWRHHHHAIFMLLWVPLFL